MITRLSTYASIFAGLTLILGACGTGTEEVDQDEGAKTAVSTSVADLPTTKHPNTEDWSPLFRRDLSDAVMDQPDSWTMNNGVLKATDHSTIWTNEEYGDFILDFEAKTPDGTNSGVFFRTEERDDILSALELQMHNPPGDDAEADDRHRYGGRNGMASLYDLQGPSGGTPKPAGEWNHITITAVGNMIYVVLNGEQVHEMNLNEWTEPGLTPDGQEHKFDRALQNQARSGPIGLQGIHSENDVSVEYRNLKIRRLNP